MSQQTVSARNKQEVKVPFRAKSAGISLFAILVIGLYYFASVIPLLPTNEAIPDGAISLVITTVILIIVLESVLQIVLYIGAGRIEVRTERDDRVNTRSARNAYFVLAAGVFITFGSMLIGFTPFEMANILLLSFFLAEIVRFSSVLLYYRQSR